MKLLLPQPPAPVELRFFADFTVQLEISEVAGMTKRQAILLQCILASPATLREVARMRLETDLGGVADKHFGELFDGPNNEDILDLVLSRLSEEQRAYWEKLRTGPGDTLHQEITPVLLAFEAKLRVAGIEQKADDAQPTRKTVGPILDAGNL